MMCNHFLLTGGHNFAESNKSEHRIPPVNVDICYFSTYKGVVLRSRRDFTCVKTLKPES